MSSWKADSDDSDFDQGNNTQQVPGVGGMIISGPHGSGKSAAVYACAQVRCCNFTSQVAVMRRLQSGARHVGLSTISLRVCNTWLFKHGGIIIQGPRAVALRPADARRLAFCTAAIAAGAQGSLRTIIWVRGLVTGNIQCDVAACYALCWTFIVNSGCAVVCEFVELSAALPVHSKQVRSLWCEVDR